MKVSKLIMNNETLYNEESPDLATFRTYKAVEEEVIDENGESKKQTRYVTWVDDKNMTSIKTPEGRELTPEELFDFIIGNNITDLARKREIEESDKADVAIVLGNGLLPVTRERAIKAFELYRRGIVKKIIFTGGIPKSRDTKEIMHPETREQFIDNSEPDIEWQDLPEADWGAETFIPDAYEEGRAFREHAEVLTDKFLESIGVNPEDVLMEPLSSSTQENAIYCKNIFDGLEIDTGEKVRKAILVTTVTHGSRAMRQFQKLYGDSIQLTWCPATLDFEKFEPLKKILHAQFFDEEAFRTELKKVYCSEPELIKKLMEETANHRNAFILGDIYDATITTLDEEKQQGPRDDER